MEDKEEKKQKQQTNEGHLFLCTLALVGLDRKLHAIVLLSWFS
jgi:hypothetical protein